MPPCELRPRSSHGDQLFGRADRRRNHHRFYGARGRALPIGSDSGVTTIRSRAWRSSARCSRSCMSPRCRFAMPVAIVRFRRRPLRGRSDRRSRQPPFARSCAAATSA